MFFELKTKLEKTIINKLKTFSEILNLVFMSSHLQSINQT